MDRGPLSGTGYAALNVTDSLAMPRLPKKKKRMRLAKK
jgi:hypothetical protein